MDLLGFCVREFLDGGGERWLGPWRVFRGRRRGGWVVVSMVLGVEMAVIRGAFLEGEGGQ